MKYLVTYKWRKEKRRNWKHSYAIVDDLVSWIIENDDLPSSYVIINHMAIGEEEAERLKEAAPKPLISGV